MTGSGHPVILFGRDWPYFDQRKWPITPYRLIVCVHHPSVAEDAGMDLYEALEEREVTWDGLEAAA